MQLSFYLSLVAPNRSDGQRERNAADLWNGRFCDLNRKPNRIYLKHYILTVWVVVVWGWLIPLFVVVYLMVMAGKPELE